MTAEFGLAYRLRDLSSDYLDGLKTTLARANAGAAEREAGRVAFADAVRAEQERRALAEIGIEVDA